MAKPTCICTQPLLHVYIKESLQNISPLAINCTNDMLQFAANLPYNSGQIQHKIFSITNPLSQPHQKKNSILYAHLHTVVHELHVVYHVKDFQLKLTEWCETSCTHRVFHYMFHLNKHKHGPKLHVHIHKL